MVDPSPAHLESPNVYWEFYTPLDIWQKVAILLLTTGEHPLVLFALRTKIFLLWGFICSWLFPYICSDNSLRADLKLLH